MHFCKRTSILWHHNALEYNWFVKFSSRLHLHIALVKLSNCCVEKRQTLFHRSRGLKAAHASTQLTIRYGRPCRNVFTRQIFAVLTNWNGCWFTYGASFDCSISNITTDQWCKRLWAQGRLFWAQRVNSQWSYTTCSVWLACSNTQYFNVKNMCKKCWYLLHKFVRYCRNAVKVEW